MSCDLTLSRDLYVPRELVFEVWTDAAHLSAWYAEEEQAEAVIEANPGGRFRVSWHESGALRVLEGTFREVDAPGRLRCTVEYAQGFPGGGVTELTLALADLRGATRIDLEQSGFASAERRDEELERWDRRLDRLEAYFSQV